MDADVCDSDLRELVLTLLNPSEYGISFHSIFVQSVDNRVLI